MARIRTKGATAPTQKLDARAVAKSLATNPKGIDSGMLLNALIENWGGPSLFAAAIFEEFHASKPGSLSRQKILEMVSRLTVAVTSQEIAKPKRSEDLSDEELYEAAAGLMARMSNGTPAPAPAEETPV